MHGVLVASGCVTLGLSYRVEASECVAALQARPRGRANRMHASYLHRIGLVLCIRYYRQASARASQAVANGGTVHARPRGADSAPRSQHSMALWTTTSTTPPTTLSPRWSHGATLRRPARQRTATPPSLVPQRSPWHGSTAVTSSRTSVKTFLPPRAPVSQTARATRSRRTLAVSQHGGAYTHSTQVRTDSNTDNSSPRISVQRALRATTQTTALAARQQSPPRFDETPRAAGQLEGIPPTLHYPRMAPACRTPAFTPLTYTPAHTLQRSSTSPTASPSRQQRTPPPAASGARCACATRASAGNFTGTESHCTPDSEQSSSWTKHSD